jgi:hypothetical protein
MAVPSVATHLYPQDVDHLKLKSRSLRGIGAGRIKSLISETNQQKRERPR